MLEFEVELVPIPTNALEFWPCDDIDIDIDGPIASPLCLCLCIPILFPFPIDIEMAWWIGTWQNAPGKQEEEEEEMLDIVLDVAGRKEDSL